jgi:hypothetical protein
VRIWQASLVRGSSKDNNTGEEGAGAGKKRKHVASDGECEVLEVDDVVGVDVER